MYAPRLAVPELMGCCSAFSENKKICSNHPQAVSHPLTRFKLRSGRQGGSLAATFFCLMLPCEEACGNRSDQTGAPAHPWFSPYFSKPHGSHLPFLTLRSRTEPRFDN